MQEKLILVFSEEFEASTNHVLEWLQYYKQKFYRVNAEDNIKCLNLKHSIDSFYFELLINDTDLIKSTDIKSFWYRRGNVQFHKISENFSSELSNDINDKINSHLNMEVRTLNEFLYFHLENNIFSIGKRSNSRNNKLIHFEIAKKLKIKTPSTYVCNTKKQVLNIFRKNPAKTFVVKCISDGTILNLEGNIDKKGMYQMYTEIISEKEIDKMSLNFFPSLVQERLPKRYELRIFYLHGDFFPMAIFSQNNSHTKVDFRHYDDEKPNRWVPYKLPIEIEKKLKKFMDKVELNTGSIDIIVTPDLDFYFLEVNPVGQFGMVSFPCNYNLEKKIAKVLMNKNY